MVKVREGKIVEERSRKKVKGTSTIEKKRRKKKVMKKDRIEIEV